MVVRRVPLGFKILIGSAIFLFIFILTRPSDPATKEQIDFWKKAAAIFGENDIEGFVGIALLVVCTIVTFLCYKIAIRLIEQKLNR